MIWRRQLPVYSPLSMAALARGLAAAVSGGTAARSCVDGWIRERFGSRQSLLTDSGTSALALAMQAATRRSPGKPILLPTYSCYDLVTAAMAAGAQVGWYDIEPGTLQPDVGAHGWASLPDAAAIVVVHHYGIPADMTRIRSLADAGGAHSSAPVRAPLLIEDAAQAIGGQLEGRPLGSFGDFGVLSFGRGKGMTGGGGGALLANTREAGELLNDAGSSMLPAPRGGGSLISTGAQWLLARPTLYAVPASLPFLQLGATVFRSPHSPRAMSAANGGTLATTLGYEDNEGVARQRHAGRFQRLAAPWSIPVVGSGARAGYLRFPVLLPESLAGFRESPALRRLGIMPGYPVPLPSLPESPFPRAAAPGGSVLASRLVTLPVHSLLRENDIVLIERVLEEWRSRIPPG